MEDAEQAAIAEAVTLTRKELDLERELDALDYTYKNARTGILNELTAIRLRQGELIRLYGISPSTQRSASAR